MVLNPRSASGSSEDSRTSPGVRSAKQTDQKNSWPWFKDNVYDEPSPFKTEQRTSFRPWADENHVEAPPLASLLAEQVATPLALEPPALIHNTSPIKPRHSSSSSSSNQPRHSSSGSTSNRRARSPTKTDPSRYCQSLVGSTVAPCEVLLDTNGQEGMFFVFHDLSIRTQGQYRLRFLIVDLNL